jgi:N6-adenosine-specific RNA methylase IME4
MLRNTEIADSTTQLLDLARLTPEHQRQVTDKVVRGEARNVKAAIRDVLTPAPIEPPQLPPNTYRCIVIDPPWQVEKILRDVRPAQVEFDYPTMDADALRALPVSDLADDSCHLYLWTTHKHLPLALSLAEAWGFRYQCLMTWVKNVGFTPFSWMYSTEHVLFCRRGSLDLTQLGRRLDFSAPVREHSRKPEVFYDLVRECSPGPRLEMFARQRRDGFDVWGSEVDHFDQEAL